MPDFNCLLEEQLPRLRRYARALLRDTVRADDLVQDTVVRVLETAPLAAGQQPAGMAVHADAQLRRTMDVEADVAAVGRASSEAIAGLAAD